MSSSLSPKSTYTGWLSLGPLFQYASVMSLLTLAELSACAWLASRAVAFLNSEAARDLLQLLEARDHLRAALQILSKWLPLPKKIQELIDVSAILSVKQLYSLLSSG